MSNNKEVEIRLLESPRKEYGELDLLDEPKVKEIIRNRVLPQSKGEYYRVDVKIKREDHTPQYLVAYMLRKDIYLAEVVKVDVDSNLNEKGITFNYDVSKEKEDEDEEEKGFLAKSGEEYECGYDFVVSTPVPDIPTAKAAVQYIYDLACSVGLRTKMLLGPEASVANYKMYLTSGLMGFVNIGHGNTSLIALSDGPLDSAWFKSLNNQALKPAVIYFNSCQTFNDPLKSAIMGAGDRTFIGGIVNLLIGPSEEVCKCFWSTILKSSTSMGDVLHQCERDKYPNPGSHGIIGDTGSFVANLRLAHAMWVHGHSMQIEYPDLTDFQKRMGFFIQVKGKPSTYNWFHFAVPTPVIVDNQRLRVGSIMIRFRTSPGASVDAVHIYDGETGIAFFNGLNLSPQGSFVWPRFQVLPRPPIKWGLGISIGVKFNNIANSPNNFLIEISSVGCDFLL